MLDAAAAGNASWLVLLPLRKGRRLTQHAGRAKRLDFGAKDVCIFACTLEQGERALEAGGERVLGVRGWDVAAQCRQLGGVSGQCRVLALFHRSRFPWVFLFVGELLGKVVLDFQKCSESVRLIKEEQPFGELGYSSVRPVLC